MENKDKKIEKKKTTSRKTPAKKKTTKSSNLNEKKITSKTSRKRTIKKENRKKEDIKKESNKVNILSNCSFSFFPINIGVPIIISAKMHPILQISTEVSYIFEPSKISGALYHKVTTSFVYILIGIP